MIIIMIIIIYLNKHNIYYKVFNAINNLILIIITINIKIR